MNKILCFALFLLLCMLLTSHAQQKSCVTQDKTINNIIGTIKRISPNSEWWVIVSDETEMRYAPSNLSNQFKKDGLRVMYSGKVVEIPADVRLIGIPLTLTSIKKLDTQKRRPLPVTSKTTPSTCNGLKTMTKYGIYEGQLHQS